MFGDMFDKVVNNVVATATDATKLAKKVTNVAINTAIDHTLDTVALPVKVAVDVTQCALSEEGLTVGDVARIGLQVAAQQTLGSIGYEAVQIGAELLETPSQQQPQRSGESRLPNWNTVPRPGQSQYHEPKATAPSPQKDDVIQAMRAVQDASTSLWSAHYVTLDSGVTALDTLTVQTFANKSGDPYHNKNRKDGSDVVQTGEFVLAAPDVDRFILSGVGDFPLSDNPRAQSFPFLRDLTSAAQQVRSYLLIHPEAKLEVTDGAKSMYSYKKRKESLNKATVIEGKLWSCEKNNIAMLTKSDCLTGQATQGMSIHNILGDYSDHIPNGVHSLKRGAKLEIDYEAGYKPYVDGGSTARHQVEQIDQTLAIMKAFSSLRF